MRLCPRLQPSYLCRGKARQGPGLPSSSSAPAAAGCKALQTLQGNVESPAEPERARSERCFQPALPTSAADQQGSAYKPELAAKALGRAAAAAFPLPQGQAAARCRASSPLAQLLPKERSVFASCKPRSAASSAAAEEGSRRRCGWLQSCPVLV